MLATGGPYWAASPGPRQRRTQNRRTDHVVAQSTVAAGLAYQPQLGRRGAEDQADLLFREPRLQALGRDQVYTVRAFAHPDREHPRGSCPFAPTIGRDSTSTRPPSTVEHAPADAVCNRSTWIPTSN